MTQASGPDVRGLLALLNTAKQFHAQLYDALSLIDDRIKKQQYSLPDIVDIGFLCREMSELFDVMRKDATKRCNLSQMSLVTQYTASALTDNPLPESITGTLASARNMRINKIAELPEFGGTDYIAYMESLGIPDEVIKKGLVKPDWSNTKEHITTLLEDGKKLPPGFGQTWNEYVCTFYRTRRKLTQEDSED